MNGECPVCGSTRLTPQERTHSAHAIMGAPVQYSVFLQHCEECGETGDFFGDADNALEAALAASEKSSIEPMMQRLQASGITMSYFERALGLPARTTARWKSGEISAAPLALLRLVSTFPWLLGVADAAYDAGAAAEALMRATGEMVKEQMERRNLAATVSFFNGPQSVQISATVFSLDGPAIQPEKLPSQASFRLVPMGAQ